MNKWLKYAGILALVALIVGAIAAVVVAQGPQDRDRDGTCDCGAGTAGDGQQRGSPERAVRPSEGSPQDGNAPGQGRGPFANGEHPCDEFVDEDGDGVCDLRGEAIGDGEQHGRRFNENENGRGQMGGGRMRAPRGQF